MRIAKNASWVLLIAGCALAADSLAQPRPMVVSPAPPVARPVAVPAPAATAAPATAQPKTGPVVVPMTAPPPIRLGPGPLQGWVDLHAHPMSYLGFGGKVIAGGVDVGSFLPSDEHCNHGVIAATMEQALGNDNAIHGGWGLDNGCGDAFRNTVINNLETANHALNPPEGGHGAPAFVNWPAWNDITHQKMWVDWILRAKLGGQRVMVALAVNNKTLADGASGPGDGPDDDRASADLQTQKMKEFVARHSDFMQIAYGAAELESIVRANKLAIVLGMEVDNLGNFNRSPANDATVSAEITRLYNEGIRYVFPIHVIDNAFGGTAVYEGGFNTSNYREAGHFWNLMCATPDDGIRYQYKPDGFDLMMSVALETKLGIDGFRRPPDPPNCASTGHKNTQGLTPLGQFAIKEMMKHGMLVDIDHMSQFSAEAALAIAEGVPGGGYPVMSGHNGLRGVSAFNENNRTAAQLHRIAMLHGMFGLGDGGMDAYAWVRIYALAVSQMEIPGPQPNYGAVGMGTDLNGMVPGAKPRFGSQVSYSPFFTASSLGSKTWDYNRDGVAHYGMLWDFLKDAETAPNGKHYMDYYLNQSADYFWHTWQKAEAQRLNVH
jgi:microsomal dipeptidase-like Zn-dependent dipeptidase